MKKPTNTNRQKSHNQAIILNIGIDSTPKGGLLKIISDKLSKKIQFYIVTPNPEIILQAQNNPDLSHSLNSADFSIPDGVGLVVAAKILGQPSLKTIKGRQLMLDLFKIANTKKLKVYIISKQKVIDIALEKIRKEYPDIDLKGGKGPWLDQKANPVSEVDRDLQFEIVKEINSFKPDLLFVAFGAPKQEIWIEKWLPKLKVTAAMGVGGALDYYSGYVKPVPDLLENLKLEWLWRLIQNPKRIGRIVNAVIIFPMRVILSKFAS